jgi:hypothetical protein
MAIRLIYILLFSLILSSCVTQSKCNSKFPPVVSTTVEVVKIPQKLIIPTVTISDSLSVSDIQILEVEKPILIYDTTGKVQLKIWKNKYNELVIKCQALEQEVGWIEEHKTTTTEVVREIERKVIPWWVYVIITTLVIIIILLIIVKLIT